MMTFYIEYHIEDQFSHVFVNAADLEEAQSIIDDHIYRACKHYEKEHHEQSVEGYYCDARIDHIYVRIM